MSTQIGPSRARNKLPRVIVIGGVALGTPVALGVTGLLLALLGSSRTSSSPRQQSSGNPADRPPTAPGHHQQPLAAPVPLSGEVVNGAGSSSRPVQAVTRTLDDGFDWGAAGIRAALLSLGGIRAGSRVGLRSAPLNPTKSPS
jgi:hypothetical protein